MLNMKTAVASRRWKVRLPLWQIPVVKWNDRCKCTNKRPSDALTGDWGLPWVGSLCKRN